MSAIFSKKNLIIITTIIIIIILGYFILPVSMPIIAALITAMLLTPIVRVIQKGTKVKRNLAVFIVFMIFLCFIGLIGYFITTKAITQADYFVKNLPSYITEINYAWMDMQSNLNDKFEDLPTELVREIDSYVQDTLSGLRSTVSSRNFFSDITSILTKIPSYLVTFLVYLIALYLFLLELPKIKEKIFTHLSEKTKDKVQFMSSRLSFVIFGFIKAQFLVSIIIFIVSLIGLLLIVPEVALLMAFIIWIIDFIPIIGSIAILAPWAIYHLIAGNMAIATKLLVLAGILLIIRRTVEPKVMGQQIGLSPLATLIAMYIGLMLLGVIGFIVGPLVVILFTSAKEAGIIKANFKI
ncbi:sporulation integral membrane protein YtvI [Anaerobacillus alkalidiazotrophicus]|uniref:Sporulation integral membrane protein YtvI n=1 Tax=Anaerobacillus alkalidiazotrophicus TaxID=472963 RepID=A0A1S2LZI6_9BACI|nr:sporulation integral membrane protein YtvI [Anaerobacillus alkalidiazotrophicus]OIJ17714.1 sporulation integral membrane protein YtvI [Anaerobacillus alkalidiazotrophicus]